jgi:hypothetical protein
MTQSRKIPITNKSTGKLTMGKAANVQAAAKPRTAQRDDRATASELPSERQDSPSANTLAAEHIDSSQPAASGHDLTQDVNKKKGPPVENLEQFIAYAYSRQGQRITLKPAVEKAICRHPKLSEEARSRLLRLAGDDLLLAVPCQLLLIVRDIAGYPVLNSEMRNFVRQVLEMHPAFSRPELKSALGNQPDAPGPESAMAMLVTSDFSALPDLKRDKPLRSKDFDELRANAAYCLAVWFTETRGLSIEKINQLLYETLWRPMSPGAKDETVRLRYLTEIRDLAGVGLACATFKRQSDEMAYVVADAGKKLTTASEHVTALTMRNEQLRRDLDERDRRLAALHQALESERRDHAHTRAHLQDDFEQLRTRLLRRIKAEVNLLTEGLHALRRDPPKIHVMEDHAERALDALRKAVKELEDDE